MAVIVWRGSEKDKASESQWVALRPDANIAAAIEGRTRLPGESGG
ncbi:MAG: hypothetical protein P8011_15900 [Acidihalobacter sp.]